MLFNSVDIEDKTKEIINENFLDTKISEKLEIAQQDKEIKDKVNDIFSSILEENDKESIKYIE